MMYYAKIDDTGSVLNISAIKAFAEIKFAAIEANASTKLGAPMQDIPLDVWNTLPTDLPQIDTPRPYELAWDEAEGDLTPPNAVQVCSWDGQAPYVTMITGTGPVDIPFAGWPQITKEEYEAL